MKPGSEYYVGGSIFDGTSIRKGMALYVRDGQLVAIIPEDKVDPDAARIDVQGDILSHGYVDLQVNGGDGVMFNDDPSVETIARIAIAHRRLGVTALLPTLITDTRQKTQAAIAATVDAIASGLPGIAGLHLEGPHLSTARKGAHDAGLIRPMEKADLHMLCKAAQDLPVLKVTVAPETTTPAQITALAAAGALVSLGHTDASYDTCLAHVAAGARCATHLFNAMSQMGNREPGLVGAVLTLGDLSAGLIADGIHVHPASMRAAWAAKTGPGEIFLVSDAMAVAGTDATDFKLGNRKICRNNNTLTLKDGTLAGADLDLTTAVANLVENVGIPIEGAFRAATVIPASIIGLRASLGEAGPVSVDQIIRIDMAKRTASPLSDPTSKHLDSS